MRTLKSTIIFGLLLALFVIGCEEVLGLGDLRPGTGGGGGMSAASMASASSGGGSTLSSSGGACGSPCVGGLTCCGDTCTYTGSDAKNCGTCGVVCATDAICNGGTCICAGGAVCGAGSACCGSICTNLATDSANCSACGISCTAPFTCNASECNCGATCSNLALDPANCGGCGGACPLGDTCSVSGCSDWSSWSMPNPVSTGLPHPASYTSMTGMGYVLDNVTGLWWQQPIDVGITNCSGGCTAAQAIAYCQNLSLAGHSDWRLPTRIELVSIVDTTVTSPSINGVFSGTPSAAFWTSSPYVVLAGGNVWAVSFDDGTNGGYEPENNPNRVRCVR
jgi:hypothetical protein